MNEITHRGNFITWLLVHSATLITMIIFFKIIYLGTNSINGWTQYQSLLVLGVGSLIGGLGSLTFFPFMYGFSRDVGDGTLDRRLTRPLDILFQCAFHWVDVEDIIIAPTSLILICYALYQLNPSHLIVNIIISALLVVSSMFLLFSSLTLLQSLAFKSIQVNAVINFFWSFVNITKYPAKAITNVPKIGLILLFPAAIISSVPSEILFGRFDWPWITSSVILAGILLVVSRKVFMSSLKNYSSASS